MSLIGHLTEQRAFLDALNSGRTHHAWLLSGPSGIGKARFAVAAATQILARAAGPQEGVSPDSLDVSPDHRVARLVASGAHPDLRIVTRIPNEKTGKLNSNILIDQIRDLQSVFHSRPSYSDWRVVVIDCADEFRREAANAFLKFLEEPPPGTVLLLVSHAPARLLPTIRSRCRTLRFQPLSDADTRAVVTQCHPEAGQAEIDALMHIAGGSPGRAIRFAGLDIAGLTLELAALAAGGSTDRALGLARSLSGKTAQPRFEAFLELVPAFIAEAARTLTGGRLATALALWEEASKLAADALPLSLEVQSTAFRLATLVGNLHQAQR